MDSKILSEKASKDALTKLKLKDNGLQRALADYEDVEESDFDDQLKCLSRISQLSNALKKSKEAAGNRDAEKYLNSLVGAATLATTQAQTAKKETAKQGNQEPDTSDYSARLLAGLQKLKSAKDAAFEFLVCDAKPLCGVMVAKKITSQDKAELMKISGGTHFLPLGTCAFQDGAFEFRLDKPVTGLAKRLQDSIKNFTGKKFPIKAGQEAIADDEAPGSGAPKGDPAPQQSGPQAASTPAARVALDQAPQHWHSVRGTVDGIIKNLKQAVTAEYAGAGKELEAEIDKTMSMLDVILDKLDHRLADSLEKAASAKDPASKQAELKNSKIILTDYIKYVKTEPLIAHIDDNPLGIQTNLKKTLADSLTTMARTIG